MRTVLCREKTSKVKVTILAEIVGECLMITGQDVGNGCIELWGKEERHYSYEFDPENTTKIYAALSKDVDESSLMPLLAKFFSGMYGCRRLEELCEKNGIAYSFSAK